MVGHGVGSEMENALDLNMFITLWSMVVDQWWFGDALRLLGREHGTKLKVGWIGIYTFTLENFLWSTIHNYNMDPSGLVFQEKNDPKHMSKIVQEWLASQSFQLFQWSTQSPELNPIDHFWDFSNNTWTNLRHLQEVPRNCGSVCV